MRGRQRHRLRRPVRQSGSRLRDGAHGLIGDDVVLEGLHPLKHALRFGARVERAVASDPQRVVALALELAPDVAGAIAELVQPGASGDFDVLAWAARPEPRPLGDGPVVLLDHPRHLGNVGAAIRVAAAAGAGGVLVRGVVDPWHAAAVRGAAGLQFALPVERVDEPPGDRPFIGFDPTGGSPADIPDNAVLGFGSERHGLSAQLRERADALVAIPMRPGVSSLNLATAVSAALYGLLIGRGRS